MCTFNVVHLCHRKRKGMFYLYVCISEIYLFIYESLRAILCALVLRLQFCGGVGGGQMKKLIVMGARESRFNVPQAE